jgi:hypothetical protein
MASRHHLVDTNALSACQCNNHCVRRAFVRGVNGPIGREHKHYQAHGA